MMLRVVLIAMLFVAVGLSGCKKEEPTPAQQMDQMKQDAEKTADDMKDQAEDMADDAKEAVDDAQDNM